MQADTILTNGRITTGNPAAWQAEAVAIRDGRFIAVGSTADLDGISGPRTDLHGLSVIPGLIDAHVHLSMYARALQDVDLNWAASAQEAAEWAAERAHTLPPGTWVRGSGWDQTRWADGQFPAADILDTLIPDHPVYLVTRSAHAAWANSAALKAAGITRNTPDPAGGEIARDESGSPTGLLLESAMELVSGVIPAPSDEEAAAAVKAAIERAHRGGLTGLHDFDGASAFRAYQILHQRGDLTLRIVKTIRVRYLDEAIRLGLRWGFGDDWLRVGGVKTFTDGALGPRTAWMIDAYENEPGNTGICVTDPEQIYHDVSRASAAGLPSTIHAIGDKAVHEVLNVYQAVRKEEAARGVTPDQMRHRIEHVQLIHPADAHRLGKMGIIASMQPTHATSDMEMADRFWGHRCAGAYNWRQQLNAGAVLAFGSDAPIEAIEPLPGIMAAVTRRRPDGAGGTDGWYGADEGRLSVDEVLGAFTMGAAYAAGTETHQGQIKAGYLADLVVLGEDLHQIDPMTIGETPVLGTMTGGGWRHRTFD